MIVQTHHLETITKFVAAREKRPKTANFALLSVARELLPQERIKICYRYKVPQRDVEIWHNTEKSNAYYTGLMKCGMSWICPLCSARLSEQRRQQIREALDNSQQTYIPVMVTYTARHDARTPLKSLLERMIEAYASMRRSRLWKTYKEEYMVQGEVRTVEITHGQSGWHPHFHTLMFLSIEMLKIIGDENDYQLQQRIYAPLEAHLTAVWIHELRRHGLEGMVGPALRVTGEHATLDDYLTKQGSSMPNLAQKWGVAEELTKSNRKKSRDGNYNVWDLLLLAFVCGEPYGRLFREYYYATKGKSAMQWTPGMLAKLKVLQSTDENALTIEPETGDDLLLRLTSDQWRVILSANAEGRLLDECATGDYERMARFLDKIGAPILEQ